MSIPNAALSTEHPPWKRVDRSARWCGNHDTDREGHPESVASSKMAQLAWSHPAQGLSFSTFQSRLLTSHPMCLEDP